MLELPSEVVDRKYLRMPPATNIVDNDKEWSEYGKWIFAIPAGDWSQTNKAWIDLQVLLEDDSLVMIKSTTAAFGDEPSLLMCFTKPGKETIRRAAESIRKVINFRGIMYYKTNSLTESKIDRRYGYKDISIHMHSYLGGFYSRDESDIWRLDGDNGNRSCVQTAVPLKLDDGDFAVSGVQIPSKYSGNLLVYPRSLNLDGMLQQSVDAVCSLKADKYDLTEANRLWIAGRRLIKEGALKKIGCCKNPKRASIKFYIPDNLSVLEIAEICDKLLKISSVKVPMHFKAIKEGRLDLVLCKFLSGELYEDYKFVASVNINNKINKS